MTVQEESLVKFIQVKHEKNVWVKSGRNRNIFKVTIAGYNVLQCIKIQNAILINIQNHFLSICNYNE